MRAQPSYIRTIKPNQNRSATEYDSKAVLHQVKYLGLQENIRVRRAGFAYRNTFEKMVERFYLLSPATSYAGEYTWQGDARSGCERILTDTGIAKEEWQMGVTKAFIKNPETVRWAFLRQFDGCLTMTLYSYSLWRRCVIATGTIWQAVYSVRGGTTCATSMSVLGASSASGRTTRKRSSTQGSGTMATRSSRAGRSAGGSVSSVIAGSWATTCMSTRKTHLARSWHPLLESGVCCLSSHPFSTIVNRNAGEKVTFSSRCEILVSKTGRSSKPSPRFLLLVRLSLRLMRFRCGLTRAVS